MSRIKLQDPIIEQCELSIYFERRISKHGDKDIILWRVEQSDGTYHCFSSFDAVIDFVKLNF